ncbi:M13-type metalloendopeptidase [Massilia sp. CF038]|uniref:M13 family metallopeptidase n=1 Tax=Massilia sp. CF038 TaxID=1881045 RepID=UPI0015B6222F
MAAFAGAAEPAATAAPATTAAPAAGTLASGISTQYVDPAVRAQDDMFVHTNGGWLKSTEIPAEKASWGSFAKLRDDVTPQIRSIIEALQKDDSQKAGSQARKVGDLYASYMDEARRDELGFKPLSAELAKIHGLRDKKALPAMFAHLTKIGVTAPYGVYVGQDARDSTRYAAHVYQNGLGLPDPDYYLKADDAKMADIKAKYEKHVAEILGMAGRKDAAAAAKAIVALETELAKVQWTKVEQRDPVKSYNKVSLAKLNSLTPGFDLKASMAATGISAKTDYVIVSEPSYLTGFSKVLAKTDLATWKSYLEWQLLNSYAGYLSKPFSDAHFAFFGTALTGVTEQEPVWKRGVGLVEGAMGEAVGKQYVEQYFPAERKARMEVLVKNLLEAFRQSIDTLDWMGPATKKEAQDKLAKFTPKIGYPNKWLDYSALTVARDDLVGNVMRSNTFDYNRNLNKLGKPIDRDEWGMTPQTVNAYYNPQLNEIVFPASILQPPFFDMNADDAANYGGIGAVIGHEISHGFDDQGSQFDGNGNLRDWWTAEDRTKFKAKTAMLVNQYGAYSPVDGYKVNGELTLGENIGDNSGVAIAYKAYKLSLKGKTAPVIDGLTGDQRFFMGFAQVWRIKMREAKQIQLVKTDPHSPGKFRANGTLMNQQGYYDAFGVKEGDKMYLPPKERVTIW